MFNTFFIIWYQRRAVKLLVGEAQCYSHTCLQKNYSKTINDKLITVFIATKQRINFSIINYSFNFCCSFKAKSILEVAKILKGSLLFVLTCGYYWSFRAC